MSVQVQIRDRKHPKGRYKFRPYTAEQRAKLHARILELHDKGRGISAIFRTLKLEGFKKPNGKPISYKTAWDQLETAILARDLLRKVADNIELNNPGIKFDLPPE